MPAYLFVMLLALQAPQSAPPAAPLTTENLGQAYYFFLQGRLLEGRDDLPGAQHRVTATDNLSALIWTDLTLLGTVRQDDRYQLSVEVPSQFANRCFLRVER